MSNTNKKPKLTVVPPAVSQKKSRSVANKIDFEQVEQLSMQCLDDRHIRLLLGLTEKQFFDLKKNQKYKDAIERGKAKVIAFCASTIIKAAQGKLGSETPATCEQCGKSCGHLNFGDAEKAQLKAAELYLKQNGGLSWRKK